VFILERFIASDHISIQKSQVGLQFRG